MSSLVHHYFTLQAFVALSAQAPYAVLANLAQSRARETFRLIFVPVDEINLPPSPSAAPVNAPVLACALRARPRRHIAENVNDELVFFV